MAVSPSTLAVDVARDVDRRVVVVDERDVGVGEVGEAVAQRVDLLVDVLVGRPRASGPRPAARRSRQLDQRAHLDDGVELDVAVSSPAVISISGGAITSTSSRWTAST